MTYHLTKLSRNWVEPKNEFDFLFEHVFLFTLHSACRAENKNCVKCYGHRACIEIPRPPRVIITYHLYLRFWRPVSIVAPSNWHATPLTLFNFKKTIGSVWIVILISICSAKKGKVGSWIRNLVIVILPSGCHLAVIRLSSGHQLVVKWSSSGCHLTVIQQ